MTAGACCFSLLVSGFHAAVAAAVAAVAFRVPPAYAATMPWETSLQAIPRSRGLCRLMTLLPFYKWGAPTSPGECTSRFVSISLFLNWLRIQLYYYIIGSKINFQE